MSKSEINPKYQILQNGAAPAFCISDFKSQISTTTCSRRRAFSLLEVIIVMTVIGVLMAMTVPHYQRAIEQSRADIAAANLPQFGPPSASTGWNNRRTPPI